MEWNWKKEGLGYGKFGVLDPKMRWNLITLARLR
jgi:hypothetical protein